MESINFKDRATNPKQYDSGSFDWNQQTILSPTRKFFYDYLEQNLEALNNRTILDIGSGTGYLSTLYTKLGANKIYGVDPSSNNILISQKIHPEMTVQESSFENFVSEKMFDVAVCVMVFEHIADPGKALKKIFNLLNPKGHLYLIVGDKDYSSAPHFGHQITSQELENREVATETIRKDGIVGTLYDIFRPLENYIKYGTDSGLNFIKSVPLTPTEELIKQKPNYIEFKNFPICHLLIFSKSKSAE